MGGCSGGELSLVLPIPNFLLAPVAVGVLPGWVRMEEYACSVSAGAAASAGCDDGGFC